MPSYYCLINFKVRLNIVHSYIVVFPMAFATDCMVLLFSWSIYVRILLSEVDNHSHMNGNTKKSNETDIRGWLYNNLVKFNH
jgi:hypothetical protein